MKNIFITMLILTGCMDSGNKTMVGTTAEEYLRQTYVLQAIELEEDDYQKPNSMMRTLIEYKKPSADLVNAITNGKSAKSYIDFVKNNMSFDAIQRASKAAKHIEPILKKIFDAEIAKREKFRFKDPNKEITKEDILAAKPPKVEDEKRLKLIENLMRENLDLESVSILSLDKVQFIQTNASNAYASLTDDEVKLLTAFYSHPDVKRERQLYFYQLRHQTLLVERLMSN